MSPEKQRIAIAEFCGWKKIKIDYALDGQAVFETFWWHPSFGEPATADIISEKGRINPPDYFNDLNAIHEAEKILCVIENPGKYLDQLVLVVAKSNGFSGDCPKKALEYIGISPIVCASAAQRTEAVLRTICKWGE